VSKVERVGEEMVLNQTLGLGEPPVAHLGEDGALAGDAVGEDDVEGGEPVGGDEEQSVAEVEDLADLARGEEGVGQAVD
jgi:hypothetical protein